ncbi:MAG: class I SAM-dependent rRNA methyltransferase [Bacteroidia bacterium]
MNYPVIQLHKGKEVALKRLHPWVFSGAIKILPQNINDGDIVKVVDANNNFLAIAYYATGSIALRVLSFTEQEINVDFWKNKLKKAWEYRKHLQIMNSKTNVFRLFFGEGDGASGLIIDYYDGHAVFQCHSYGIYLQRKLIATALIELLNDKIKSIYDKSNETLPKQFADKCKNEFLFGSITDKVIVKENNHFFNIDFINGQKTGFFIDQRENRQLLQGYCKNKMVLNTFCYTGGFSIYAAKTATEVHSVDVSAKAIKLCDENAELNTITNNKSFSVDTFEFLKNKENLYDVIVLDPPAFAKNRNSKHNAVIGYKRLNTIALKLIKPNGILFTFSCSGVVDKNLFYNTIVSAAIEAKRNVKLLHYLSQPPDHPVTPNFPEGEYLKGIVLFVE